MYIHRSQRPVVAVPAYCFSWQGCFESAGLLSVYYLYITLHYSTIHYAFIQSNLQCLQYEDNMRLQIKTYLKPTRS